MSLEFDGFYNKITEYAQEVQDYVYVAPSSLPGLKFLFEEIHQSIVGGNLNEAAKVSILSSLKNAIIQIDNSTQGKNILAGTDVSYLTYDMARQLRIFVNQVKVSSEITQAVS